jgi:hypothetical protein
MYDELVKALHEGAEFLECSTPGIKNSFAKMCHNAADAIEELIDKLNHADDQIDRLVEAAEERRWIPVAERLPEEYVDVLCYCSRNGQYGCGEWSKEDNGTIHWIGLNGMIPTHWMPLPKTPKEES